MASNPQTHNSSRPGVDLAALRAIAASATAFHGIELVDVEWTGGVLRVTIERPGDSCSREPGEPLSGVTVDDCAAVSRDLSVALDVADVIAHPYQLEVSSPGLDRKLTRSRDFMRFTGHAAKIKLFEPGSDGQLALRGVIDRAGPDGIRIIADGKSFDVPLANIRDARLVFDAAPVKSPGHPTRQPRSKRRSRQELSSHSSEQEKPNRKSPCQSRPKPPK